MNHKPNILIVGMGEVGSAHYELLSSVYSVWGIDLDSSKNKKNQPQDKPDAVDVILVAIRYTEQFKEMVDKYLIEYDAHSRGVMVDILTTTPPGTAERFGANICRSTSRGIHPHLVLGLQTITKHIGGGAAMEFKAFYEHAGIPCHVHRMSRTVELLHLANNISYGVNLVLADEIQKLCREAGVDYFDFMKYTESNNKGYRAMGHETKVRTIATPPNGRIGGHCVVMSAQMIPESIRGPMVDILAKYNS